MLMNADVPSTTRYCSLHREMAANSLRLARTAMTPKERDCYLLAAVYCVRQALRVEKAINTFFDGADVSTIPSQDLRPPARLHG
ncbi:MAG TPA: hypothetical protein VGF97_10620 [Rhizomicrobium sp.]|jgi:hypothetical protein